MSGLEGLYRELILDHSRDPVGKGDPSGEAHTHHELNPSCGDEITMGVTVGEDGAIQGLLELAGIPYVGCDVQSSALCMDKSLAYAVVRAAGIPTPRFCVLAEDEGVVPQELSFPVFVKPARSGSSGSPCCAASRPSSRGGWPRCSPGAT